METSVTTPIRSDRALRTPRNLPTVARVSSVLRTVAAGSPTLACEPAHETT